MGRKSNEQKELERQKELECNPRLRFELNEKVSLKRFLKYYGYGQMTGASIDHLYELLKNGKMINHMSLMKVVNEGGYLIHSNTLNALHIGLSDWNSKRAKFIEPVKVSKPKEVKKPVVTDQTVSILVKEQPKVETVIITNTTESDPVVEVKIEEPKVEEKKTEEPVVEAKPKKKRGRKSKAEKEAMRLAAEQAQKEQEIQDDNK